MSSVNITQVSPLPLGPGDSKNQTTREMNKTNTMLTMMSAQAKADASFDPPTPTPVTPQLIQAFCGGSSGSSSSVSASAVIGAVGAIFIVYGIIAK
jgi:hypothetical protein